MFEQYFHVKRDPIIDLTARVRKDPNPNKLDLGVGVFKNRQGQTPIMTAIKQAELRLHQNEQTKTYLGPSGNEDFNQAIIQLIFADSVDHDRIVAVQAPGGTGGLRISAATIAEEFPQKTIWISDETWGNHISIFEAANLKIKRYDYFDPESKLVKESALIDFAKTLSSEDVLLLQGCCHNPTGADLSLDAWKEITELALKNGFLPFVDFAYQGLGDGLDEDAQGLRYMASKVSEMIVVNSCSKNFGLYRERTGCALWLAKDPNIAKIVKENICYQARVNYSVPPNYGAELVADILNDVNLTKIWQDELNAMRTNIAYNRKKLTEVLIEKTGDPSWDFIRQHKGMFTLLNLSTKQTDRLIHEHFIYTVPGGRINIAGLSTDDTIVRFADSLIATFDR